jgi:hypothetical protein
VGAQLARDLPGTGSNHWEPGLPDATESSDFAAASRQIASKLRSYALRAEAR